MIISIEELRTHNIGVRLRNHTEAELLNNMYPFHQYDIVDDLVGGYPLVISYVGADYTGSSYLTSFNEDDGYYQSKGFKIISVYEILLEEKIKVKIKLPKINGT